MRTIEDVLRDIVDASRQFNEMRTAAVEAAREYHAAQDELSVLNREIRELNDSFRERQDDLREANERAAAEHQVCAQAQNQAGDRLATLQMEFFKLMLRDIEDDK